MQGDEVAAVEAVTAAALSCNRYPAALGTGFSRPISALGAAVASRERYLGEIARALPARVASWPICS